MSGICALMRLDGRPAERAELEPMLAALAVRGPDATGAATDAPAGLGHALLATTPEALSEPMPFLHRQTGCLITADVRLDNRAGLLAALGIDDRDRVIGDGEIILRSYLRWGMDCPAHLLGDFAFAIWDPRHRRMFCARDKVGMRQLIHHFCPGKLFAAASEVEALLHHPEVPRRINEGRIGDFLEGLEATDLTSTFYLDAHRLPPAHALVVENGTLRTWRYWQLEALAPVRRTSAGENEEALRDVLTQAVRDRLRSPDPVGSMLSGGMDSGSVTAIAARLLQQRGEPPLQTFSATSSDPECPESRNVRAALGIPHIDPCLVNADEPDEYRDEMTRLTRQCREPFDGNMAMIRALYLAARRRGIRVVLDGVGGDTTLPTGDIIAYHLGRGRLLKAWAEARAQERFWSIHSTGTEKFKAATTFSAALKRQVMPGWLMASKVARWHRIQTARTAAQSLIHPDLADRVDMPERRRISAAHIRVDRDCRQATQAMRMLHPYVIVARERYDRVAGEVGIEPRDPFLDVRVLEFCLTLPMEQLRDDGWPKLILRRTMEGLVPDEIRWKSGRHHVGWRFINLCMEQWPAHDLATLRLLAIYTRIDPETGAIPEGSGIYGLDAKSDLSYLAAWLRSRVDPVDH